MLSVSFSLALVATMLIGIVLPGHHKEVDKFNGQTRRPFPTGCSHVVSKSRSFKIAKEDSHQEDANIGVDPFNERIWNFCLRT